MFKAKTPSKNMHAIQEQDLTAYLDNLGVLERIKHGREKCKFCRRIITTEIIHSLFPESSSVKFVCDDFGCIEQLINYIENGRIIL